MKTSDFPSYTHFKMINTGDVVGPFRAFMISNGHNSKVLITLTVENIQGICQCPLKISIEREGGSLILPLHASRVVTLTTDSGTFGTNLFVYGLA